MTIADQVKEKCLGALNASHVECVDHNASQEECDGNAKLDLIVVSPQFEGVPLIKRHRMVNDALVEFMPRIHALSMKTWTPAQYDSKQP
ncbi:hypothetical protein FisN_13Hu201 [Fistulifera solaris]|uniref:BolA protein n=1 Tax=Fistulifera solaris TaxID=1519565 RepID=A0A1Z5KNP6_FISSO|nr:hypothetical protein FisN_13Hu201 [Fistulifera solaris]|eukprot:GAX27702.1 hypothetical protein FisN_13Hu201 [Fistulifera solaris]